MSAFVTIPDAAGGVLEVREVKNLGWLLRHLAEVASVAVTATASGGGILRATLVGGREFESEFASASVMLDWVLARRSLRGFRVFDFSGTLLGFLGPNCRQAVGRSLHDSAFGPEASL